MNDADNEKGQIQVPPSLVKQSQGFVFLNAASGLAFSRKGIGFPSPVLWMKATPSCFLFLAEKAEVIWPFQFENDGDSRVASHKVGPGNLPELQTGLQIIQICSSGESNSLGGAQYGIPSLLNLLPFPNSAPSRLAPLVSWKDWAGLGLPDGKRSPLWCWKGISQRTLRQIGFASLRQGRLKLQSTF